MLCLRTSKLAADVGVAGLADTSWNLLWDTFHLALEREGDEREQFVVAEFGDNPAQLAEIRALLAAHDDEKNAAPDSPAQVIDNLQRLDPNNLVDTIVDDYRIQELIGEGGMGLVYAAVQLQPIKRRVALKIIKLGMDTREVIARFESERQALALMEHANIARILDAGATEDGRPYFVMDYVPGVAITEYANQAKLNLRARLYLFLDVCDALQHAHQKGIIHRDLKPSNILVENQDGKAIAKVIDFGVAKTLTQKLSEKTVYTRLGHFIGTPRYMSPEQAEMGALGVDTRSDVYSLGVILFELLTGRCPISNEKLSGSGSNDLPGLIRDTEVPRPSTLFDSDDDASLAAARDRQTIPRDLKRDLERDLDWIVLKALAKERSARYASVEEFSADIKRYFANEPVLAKPPATSYRIRKFTRRHRLGVSVAIALIMGSLAAIAGLTFGVVEARRSLAIAESEQLRSRASFDFLAGLLTRVVPDTARGEDARLLQSLLNEASATLAATPPDDDRVIADLNQTLAESYRALGDYNTARQHANASLEIWQRIAGENSAAALRTENLVALILWNMGELDESERIFRDVGRRQRMLFAQSHPDLTATKNNLALVLMSSGKYSEAMQLLKEVLAAQQATPDTDHAALLRTRFNMAALMSDMGQIAEAEAIARELMLAYRDSVGEKHPDTISTQTLIARILLRQDRIEEAQVVQQTALTAAIETLGSEHRDTLGLELIQGQIFLVREEPVAAAAVFQHIVEIAEGLPTAGTSLHLPALLGLADAMIARNDLDTAETVLARAGELAERVLPRDHALRAIIRSRHGTALIAVDKLAEGIVELTDSYPKLVELLGPTNEQTRIALRDIVNTYEKLEQHDLANQYRAEIFNTL